MMNESKAVELSMSSEEIATVALAAHQKNMKLNDFINTVLEEHIRDMYDRYPELEIGK